MREMYIYKTTNIVNGKIYVGQHKVQNKRKDYLGSGTLFKKALKKYGRINFKKEIICHCETDKQLSEMETYWIIELKANDPDIGYNILTTGYVPSKRKSNFTAEEKMELGIKNVIKSRKAKPLLCTNTGVIYRTMAEAARAIGVTYERMRCHLNNPNKAYKLTKQKLIFKFIEGQELEAFYKQYE